MVTTKELKNIAKERKLNYHNLSKEDLSRMLKIPIFKTKRYYQNIAKDRNLKNYQNLKIADLVKLLNMNPEIPEKPIPKPIPKPEKPISEKPIPKPDKPISEKPIPAPRRKPISEKPIPAPRRKQFPKNQFQNLKNQFPKNQFQHLDENQFQNPKNQFQHLDEIPQQSKKRLTRCLAGWIGSAKVVKRLPSQFHPP